MYNLIYKELKLSIHPLFHLIALLGALILIPNWIYFLAVSYIFFITIPNVFGTCKADNDIAFSLMLPISKRDIVKARIMSIIIVELINILVAVIFAIINFQLYHGQNFLLDPNAAFFGFVFIMYAIFNIIFFPAFYKTGYKIGLPTVIGTFAVLIFATMVEFIIIKNPSIHFALDSVDGGISWKLIVLIVGILIFIISTIISFKISVKRFEMVNL